MESPEQRNDSAPICMLFLVSVLQKLAANQVHPSADSDLWMLLLRGPPPDQDGHSAGLVQSVCFHRQGQKPFLVGLHGRSLFSVSLGSLVHYPFEYPVSPTPSHLGILSSKQMLLSSKRDALLSQRTGYF